MKHGTVWFIGAGRGDPELITRKGYRLIGEADLVLYAGSLVPKELVAHAKSDARVVDSAPLALEETHGLIRETALHGGMVARVHTGDPALFGAIQEQIILLEQEGIPYAVVPGVTAAFAAAAAAAASVTTPDLVQCFSIGRMAGKTPVPPEQSVYELARHKGSLAVYLSAPDAERLQEDLLRAGHEPETPVLVAYRVGWPEQRLCWTSVENVTETVRQEGFTRQVVFLVLPGMAGGRRAHASRLYAADFSHGFRG